MSNTPHKGLPIPGYRPQSDDAVSVVTASKQAEEGVLRMLDGLEGLPGIDRRWLSIGRTHIEQGFMAINRAVFKPGRVTLPGDGD